MHVISFVLTRWIINEFEKITDKNKNNNKWKIVMSLFTALLNNTRTLKLKAQPTNAFFAAVNQMFCGSSQLTTTAELCSLSELCTMI